MRKKIGVSAAIAIVAAFGAATTARATVHYYTVQLNGANEVTAAGVPNQGDPDGFGTASLAIDDSFSPPRIDWNITVGNIAFPLTGAHIHNAPSTTTGPVRVDFAAQLTGAGLADADLTGVIANPPNWYVNLHNGAFPGGAIRGQIPEPASLSLLGLGAAALLRRKRVG